MTEFWVPNPPIQGCFLSVCDCEEANMAQLIYFPVIAYKQGGEFHTPHPLYLVPGAETPVPSTQIGDVYGRLVLFLGLCPTIGAPIIYEGGIYDNLVKHLQQIRRGPKGMPLLSPEILRMFPGVLDLKEE